MPWYLGVDGGGSGCRAALADGRGVLATAAGGPANIATDPEGAAAAIRGVIEAVLARVPEARGDLRLGLGVAGANVPEAARRLAGALPFARMAIESDGVTAALGALGGADGIVAALGTGSVFARVDGGRVRQLGGWGFLLGDEGSGAVLGRRLLETALRAHDGHRALTPLLEAVLAEHGGPAGVVGFALTARPPDFAALAPRLWVSDDPAAQAILSTATAEVASFIDLLQQGGPVPVTFTGGLGPAYAARLKGRWTIVPPKGSALDGALILARRA